MALWHRNTRPPTVTSTSANSPVCSNSNIPWKTAILSCDSFEKSKLKQELTLLVSSPSDPSWVPLLSPTAEKVDVGREVPLMVTYVDHHCEASTKVWYLSYWICMIYLRPAELHDTKDVQAVIGQELVSISKSGKLEWPWKPIVKLHYQWSSKLSWFQTSMSGGSPTWATPTHFDCPEH